MLLFRKLRAFIHLTRPVFLLGGMLLYLCGAAAAWEDGFPVALLTLISGQALVTSIQLMAQYANEYYDIASDRANQARTWFSGGSGILPAGDISMQVARTAILVCAGISILLITLTGIQVRLLFLVGFASLAAAWSYSGPPMKLVGSGYGELSASLIVAFLVPTAGYLMQSGGLFSFPLMKACLPILLVHYAMLIALQIPDMEADRAAGKRTLTVRFGIRSAVYLHLVVLFTAFLIQGLFIITGQAESNLLLFAFPLAVWQGYSLWTIQRAARPSRSTKGYFMLTLGAVALLVLSALLWLLGTIYLIIERNPIQ